MLEEQLRVLYSEQAAIQAEIARLLAQMEVLEQAERSLAGYANGARLLLQAAREGRADGVRGALSANLDVPADLEVAISAVLGEYVDAVLLDGSADLESALDIMEGQAVRATQPLQLGKVEIVEADDEDVLIGHLGIHLVPCDVVPQPPEPAAVKHQVQVAE